MSDPIRRVVVYAKPPRRISTEEYNTLSFIAVPKDWEDKRVEAVCLDSDLREAPEQPVGEFKDEFEAIQERGKVYGSPFVNFDAIGSAWAATLSLIWQKPVDPLPGHVVAAMMVQFKALRSCGPSYHPDNYVDAKAYVELSNQLRKEFEKNKQ